MISLFLKECKSIGKSLVYLIFIAVTILFYVSQYSGVDKVIKRSEDTSVSWVSHYSMEAPKKLKGETLEEHYEKYKKYPYGERNEEVPELVEKNVFRELYMEYSKGSYDYYPFSYIQHKKLNNDETKRIEGILEEISGKTVEELGSISLDKEESKKLIDSINIDYGRFKELMNEVNTMIGKGSHYDTSDFERYGSVPLTYEDAVDEYNEFVYEEGISEGFAIKFCDYMGIVMALFPIFVAVFVSLKDRKSKIQEIIYSSNISSAKLIICRYLSIVCMCFLPVLILAVFSTFQLSSCVPSSIAMYFDYFAFIKFSLGFVLPTTMIVAALGMLVTLLTNGVIGIVVQIGWYFYCVFNAGLDRSYGLSFLLIRLNSGSTQIYRDYYNDILINRMFYICLSIVLVIASCVVFELNRRGKLNIYGSCKKFFRFNKGKQQNLV